MPRRSRPAERASVRFRRLIIDRNKWWRDNGYDWREQPHLVFVSSSFAEELVEQVISKGYQRCFASPLPPGYIMNVDGFDVHVDPELEYGEHRFG